jgi:hypothetical protein
MIRNGDSYGVVLAAPEATVQGLNITGANFAGIWAQPPAWYAKLLQNEIHNTQTGVVSEAFGTLAQANFITGAQTGVFLVDHGGRVAVNKVYGGVTGVFVLAGAEGAVITGNDIRHQANIGILVANARSLAIEGNRLFGVGIGIEAHCVACTGAAIASNTITDAVRYGILARSDDVGLVLQSNTVLRAARGLSVSGVGARVRLNKATDIGLDGFGPCFEIFGSANTAMQNTATRCSLTGVFLFGSTNRIESNTVAGTFENGITVSGPGTNSGNLLRANKVTGSAAQGVAVVGGASNTLVVGNSATGNRLDYCDDGVGTMAAGNAFGTVDYLGNPHCTVSH